MYIFGFIVTGEHQNPGSGVVHRLACPQTVSCTPLVIDTEHITAVAPTFLRDCFNQFNSQGSEATARGLSATVVLAVRASRPSSLAMRGKVKCLLRGMLRGGTSFVRQECHNCRRATARDFVKNCRQVISLTAAPGCRLFLGLESVSRLPWLTTIYRSSSQLGFRHPSLVVKPLSKELLQNPECLPHNSAPSPAAAAAPLR